MDQQPKIPTLKDAQKPQVKIKGMGAGLTLFDRLKQFKKKDLAFILAGLGTLFMAPLAEHFMMAPESGDAALQQGWGKGGAGSNLFGSGTSPYESGNNGIASGGAVGGAGDIITPLNVRDPSALVMGPGAAQQPPVGSAAPAVTPPASSDSKTDYKDALAGGAAAAASRAASAALKRAPLPVPKVSLGAGGLRGLGAASGGSSSGSGSLGPINSGNLGQAGTGGGGLNLVRSAPNFRGAAGPRGNGPMGLDGTKKAGANAGDAFSRTGSALSGLNAAASEQIPTGGSGFSGSGQGGSGANDKPGGGAGAAGSKSVGESLAFIEAKERMMENLKLEFEKKKLWDNSLLMGNIRNDMAKGFGTELGKVLTKFALAPLSKEFWAKEGDSVKGFRCANDNFTQFYPDTGTDYCKTSGGFMGQPDAGGACKALTGAPVRCVADTKAGKAEPAAKAETGSGDGFAGMSPKDIATMNGLGDVCKRATSEKASSDTGVKAWGASIGTRANALADAQVALVGGTRPAGCTDGKRILPGTEDPPKSLKDLQADALQKIAAAGTPKDDEALTGKIKAGTASVKPVTVSVDEAVTAVKAAQTALEAVKAHMTGMAAVSPRPEILGPSHPAENKVATDLETQMTTSKITVDGMVTNLTTVQTGLDKGMVEIQAMAGTDAALKGVITNNAKLDEETKKPGSAGYEGLTPAPPVPEVKVADRSTGEKTKAAITEALEPIGTAKAKLDAYKTALAAAPGANVEEKRKVPAVVAAGTEADTAVKTAVEKVGAMRTNMIGWVDQTKADLDGLSKMVVSPPKP